MKTKNIRIYLKNIKQKVRLKFPHISPRTSFWQPTCYQCTSVKYPEGNFIWVDQPFFELAYFMFKKKETIHKT